MWYSEWTCTTHPNKLPAPLHLHRPSEMRGEHDWLRDKAPLCPRCRRQPERLVSRSMFRWCLTSLPFPSRYPFQHRDARVHCLWGLLVGCPSRKDYADTFDLSTVATRASTSKKFARYTTRDCSQNIALSNTPWAAIHLNHVKPVATLSTRRPHQALPPRASTRPITEIRPQSVARLQYLSLSRVIQRRH